MQVGKYIRFMALGGLRTDLPHFITVGGAGVDTNGDGRVDPGNAAEANPAYRQAELEAYLTTVGVTTLVTSLAADSPADAAARRLDIPVIRLLIAEAEPAGVFALRSDGAERTPSLGGHDEHDVALILTTSGTTSEAAAP